jgi:hypothetical protein
MAAYFFSTLTKIPLIELITTLFYLVLCGRRVQFYVIYRRGGQFWRPNVNGTELVEEHP